MKLNILDFEIDTSINQLDINSKSLLVNTINPHSYCVTKKDEFFKETLQQSDVLIPDGIGIVWAVRFLTGQRIQRITGADLHAYLLNMLNQKGGKVFYLGSMQSTLDAIEARIKNEFSNIKFAAYSPPYKTYFSEEENQLMTEEINRFSPDVLFVGMTAPKQEKWAYRHKEKIDANIIASVGAVFDFYAGTIKRAPVWMQKVGMEWLHRSIINPSKLGKRNMLSNPEFVWDVLKYKLKRKK